MTSGKPKGGWEEIAHQAAATNLIIARTMEQSGIVREKMQVLARQLGRHYLYYSPQQGLVWWNPKGGRARTGGWHYVFEPGTPLGTVLTYLQGGENTQDEQYFNAPFILCWEFPHQEWGGDGEETLMSYLENVGGYAKTIVAVVPPEDQLPSTLRMGGGAANPDVPSRLKGYATFVSFPKPTSDELTQLVRMMVESSDELAAIADQDPFTFEEQHIPALQRALRGLPLQKHGDAYVRPGICSLTILLGTIMVALNSGPTGSKTLLNGDRARLRHEAVCVY